MKHEKAADRDRWEKESTKDLDRSSEHLMVRLYYIYMFLNGGGATGAGADMYTL